MPVGAGIKIKGPEILIVSTTSLTTIAGVLAGEKSTCHWAIDDHSNPKLLGRWQQLKFRMPIQQVVARLRGIHSRQIILIRDPQALGDLRTTEVGAADISHLALMNEIIQCSQRLLQRRLRVERVHLVEVDVVRLKSAQRLFDRFHDRFSGATNVKHSRTSRRAEF